jgi:long-chain fatty acid transport protein
MNRKGFTLLVATALTAVAPAWAGSGHILHGVGAVNDAMGGAGVALPNDALGALNMNPALLARLDGHRFEFSAEYPKAANAVESSVQTPVGTFSGRTEEAGDVPIIPAFGWTRNKSGHFAYGMGFLGIAGFGVDYPQDSRNPLLAPQPRGFGRVYSNYQLMKIPTALAWRLSDALSVGVSLDVARATLTANPAGFATPDCASATNCFVPSVNADSAFGFGATVGVHYQINDAFAIGGSYSSETDFEDFEWNAAVANPNLPTYGTTRRITLQVNSPAIASVGLGITPSDRLQIAIDAKKVFYTDTEGFGDTLRWEDIMIYALGVQFGATDRLTLRAGYNKAENPIPAQFNFVNVISPAIFEDRWTAGLGFDVNEALQVNLAYYRALENRSSGPFLSPFGPVAGTQVTNEMSMESAVVTFSFKL